MADTISASQFKARCLKLMDEVAASGKTLVITKNGLPVAELHPCAPQRRPVPFGLHPTTLLRDDAIEPLDEPWDALL
jgi:prevent-host-death family protein